MAVGVGFCKTRSRSVLNALERAGMIGVGYVAIMVQTQEEDYALTVCTGADAAVNTPLFADMNTNVLLLVSTGFGSEQVVVLKKQLLADYNLSNFTTGESDDIDFTLVCHLWLANRLNLEHFPLLHRRDLLDGHGDRTNDCRWHKGPSQWRAIPKILVESEVYGHERTGHT